MMRRNSEDEPVAKRKVPTVSLCNLPMDILITILSLLPINDAVRTSVLSRKFRYAWCSHTNLTFDEGTMRDKDFVTKVDTLLQKHSGVGVEHLEIKFRLDSKHSAHIDTWVQFAITSKTKEFVINLSGNKPKSDFPVEKNFHKWLDGEEPYDLPSQLFSPGNGSYLQYLDFRAVSLQLPADFNGFPNLKSLTLVDVSITDKDVQWLLSKCNLLEFFEIAYCRMVTSIRVLHPLERLKHLVLDECPTLKEIELYSSPTTLMYTGNEMVPLIFASTSRLTNINASIGGSRSSLSYILTDFPRASPRLETLTLKCFDVKRTIVPEDPFKFTYLRNLRLQLLVSRRQIDVLVYAYLLKIAPFMETLELAMWMSGPRQPYCKEDGELRSGVPEQHMHLKSVSIGGFVGFKDQVELALNILRSCMVLEKMEITPRRVINNNKPPVSAHLRVDYVNGHRVATEFVCKADHRNVVSVFF